MDHNMLMEPRSEGDKYLWCAKCQDNKRQKFFPAWFPLRNARVNHADGSMKRTWVWERAGLEYHWKRRLTEDQEAFYVARREEQARLKAQAETKFVCNACRICAENGLRGEKNHLDAGCPGDHSCDCQHMDRENIAK
jgi:hypothetical protein